MSARSLALALALALCARAHADPRVHVVAAGDSLSTLAERYRVSVERLRAWNDLEGDAIAVGQELVLEGRHAIHYRTVPGDTLSCIAERHGVPIGRLRSHNPALARGLEAGMSLRIEGGRDPRADASGSQPILHRVAHGESLARIARRHRTSVAAILALNPGLRAGPRGDRVREGLTLIVGRGRASESVGSSSCGWIAAPVRIAPHRAYVIRNPERSYATARTHERLRAGFDAVLRAHPRAPRVRVHDASLPGGGPIDDHRTHQSGRDVDLTYYQRSGCGSSGCPLRDVGPRELDAQRQWTLLSHWLRRGEIEVIYADRSLHEPLRREARRRGASEAELARWFGRIEHLHNHVNHLHVRFACDPSESRCRP